MVLGDLPTVLTRCGIISFPHISPISRPFRRDVKEAGAKAEDVKSLRSVISKQARQDSKDSKTDSKEDEALTKSLADTIYETDHFAQDEGGRLCHFVEGVYKRKGEKRVRQQVKALLEEWGRTKKWSSYRAEEVIEYIRRFMPSPCARRDYA